VQIISASILKVGRSYLAKRVLVATTMCVYYLFFYYDCFNPVSIIYYSFMIVLTPEERGFIETLDSSYSTVVLWINIANILPYP
jgi:hypothetical protein